MGAAEVKGNACIWKGIAHEAVTGFSVNVIPIAFRPSTGVSSACVVLSFLGLGVRSGNLILEKARGQDDAVLSALQRVG